MAKKRGKPVSFDAMIKFFLKNYNIPTKSDIDKINTRLDRMESLLRKQLRAGGVAKPAARTRRGPGKKSAKKAFEQVLDVIGKNKTGVGVQEINAATGFDDKKIRNILFRLHKMKKIQRKGRGVYIAV